MSNCIVQTADKPLVVKLFKKYFWDPKVPYCEDTSVLKIYIVPSPKRRQIFTSWNGVIFQERSLLSTAITAVVVSAGQKFQLIFTHIYHLSHESLCTFPLILPHFIILIILYCPLITNSQHQTKKSENLFLRSLYYNITLNIPTCFGPQQTIIRESNQSNIA